MQCLVLAGGLGTRMRPLTQTVPKALLPIAGRPFVAWQLDWLRAQGVRRVVYSLGYLGDQIQQYVGTGARWNLDVCYVHEGDQLLGTGGAVRRAVSQGVVEPDFFVLYGDSYLQVDLPGVERAYRESRLPALMTVYRNRGNWGQSNVAYQDGMITLYDKGAPRPDMEYIDYGLLVLQRVRVAEAIPPDTVSDLAPFLRDLSQEGNLAAYEATARFYEVGSPQGVEDLESHLHASSHSE